MLWFNPDILEESDGQDIAYSIVLVVYGSPEYPFNDIEKMALRNTIIESIRPELLPGQHAEIFTTKGNKNNE